MRKHKWSNPSRVQRREQISFSTNIINNQSVTYEERFWRLQIYIQKVFLMIDLLANSFVLVLHHRLGRGLNHFWKGQYQQFHYTQPIWIQNFSLRIILNMMVLFSFSISLLKMTRFSSSISLIQYNKARTITMIHSQLNFHLRGRSDSSVHIS